MAEEYGKYLNKIFKFKGGEILAGPKKGKKTNDSWMWTSWYMGERPDVKPTFYTLYYTFDSKIITQTADIDLLTNKGSSMANIKEVPNDFLHEIIKFEFRINEG